MARRLEKLHQQLMKNKEHIEFLTKCKENEVIPRGMTINNTTRLPKNKDLLENTMTKIRNNTLTWRHKQGRRLNIEIKTLEFILLKCMNEEYPNGQHDNDLEWLNKHDGNKKERLQKTHEKKIAQLMEKKNKEKQEENKNQEFSHIVNLSKKKITENQMKLLAKGLRYVPTPTKINTVEIIANTEATLAMAPKSIKMAAMTEIVTFIQRWKPPRHSNLSKEERKALKEIKQMDDIVITQADKGGKIVVMEKTEYIAKIITKLQDKTMYEEVDNPTNKIKKMINDLTKRLEKAKRISKQTRNELTSIDDLPNVRGQIKLHKEGHPMRIVTCSKNTILSPISKFALNIIRQLRETIENTVNSTRQFINDISNKEILPEENFASLDVEDLYSNVPITRAIDIAINHIGKSEKFCQSNFTKTDIKQLLLLALNNSYVQFNGKFYKQKRGLPMGNCLSPILADLYMNEYQTKHMNNVKKPGKFWRYVDDILIITTMKEEELKAYIKDLNKIKSQIRFTYEYEKANAINYLDTTSSKSNFNNEINIRWFRKPTASDRLLNYQSCHQKSIKKNIISNMTTRVITTTKNPKELNEDLEILKKILVQSNYPKQLVESTMQNTIKCQKQKDNQKEDIKQKEKGKENNQTISLPFVPGMEVLKRKLNAIKINLFFSYPTKIQSTLNKAIKPRSKSSIYQIICECGSVYNGETKVGLKNRIKQHENMIKKKEEKSEMVEHIRKANGKCKFKTNEAFVVETEINRKKRKIKESIYSVVNGSINKHEELHELWYPILKMSETNIKKSIEQKRKLHDHTTHHTLEDGDSGTEEEA